MKTTRLLLPLLLASSGFLHAAEPAKPNVLFIAVDDWNDWVPGVTKPEFGANQAITPNLDKLMHQGVFYANAHCAGIYCCPSRTSLMTGRYPGTTGCYNEQPSFAKINHPEIVDLPLTFRQNGYHVMGGGKIYHHMPGYIDMRAWDDYFIWNPEFKLNGWGLDSWGPGSPTPILRQWTEAEKAFDQPQANLTNYGIIKPEDEEKMADGIMIHWACEALSKTYNKPFFLGVGMYAPHKPNYIPQKYLDLYKDVKIKRPPLREDDLSDLSPSTKKEFENRKRMQYDRLEKLGCVEDEIRHYLAAISYADAMVGRVLSALAKSPYRDNTIVVLWSDNGYHQSEKYLFAKHTLWERTSHVPLVIAGPGLPKNARPDFPVSLVDIYPTLMDLCKIPTPKGLDGVSLVKSLAKPEDAQKRVVFQYKSQNELAVISANYRYIRRPAGEELYDSKKDPNEWFNLAGNPEYAKIKAEMVDHIPSNIAASAKGGLEDRSLKLKKEGETFEWVEKNGQASDAQNGAGTKPKPNKKNADGNGPNKPDYNALD